MTSMRMLLIFSVSCVRLVLVCSGAVHWRGGGVMTSMRMRLFVFCFLCSPCSGLFWCGTLVGRGECTDDNASDVADSAIVCMTK